MKKNYHLWAVVVTVLIYSSVALPIKAAVNLNEDKNLAADVKYDEYNPTLELGDLDGKDRKSAQWHLVNKEQNLRAFFSENGWEMGSRKYSQWRWLFSYSGIKREKTTDLIKPEKNLVTPFEHGVSIFRGVLTEHYTNYAKSGIAQKFVISEKVAGQGKLELKAMIKTNMKAKLSLSSQIGLIDGKKEIIYYKEVKVTDKKGVRIKSEVKAQAVSGGYNLSIKIDDQKAEYPLTVEPIIIFNAK